MKKIIGTHDGAFHLDETTSIALLSLTSEYKNNEIKRTRKEEELQECDIVVDVGKVFDHSKKLYDHHQYGFSEKWPNSPIIFSSAGLIFKFYGKEVILRLSKGPKISFQNDEEIEWFMNKWYFFYFISIDAEDNGTPISTVQQFYHPLGSLRSVIAAYSDRKAVDKGCHEAKNELVKSFYRLLLSWKPTAQKYPPEYFGEEVVVVDDEMADIVTLCEMAYLGQKCKIIVKKEKNVFIGRIAKDGMNNAFQWPQKWRGLYGSELKKIVGNGAICVDRMGLELISNDIETIQKAFSIAKKLQ